MSNYILLIMHEYFETLKNTKDIKNIRTKEILKEAWLAIFLFIIAIISLTFIVWRIKVNYIGWELLSFSLSVLFLIPVIQNISQKAYERRKGVYEVQINIFRKILSEFDMYDLKKIQELIAQCDFAYTEYKLSQKLIDPVVKMGKSVFLPILTFISGLAVKNLSISLTLAETTKYTTYIIGGIIVLLIFIYEIKWLLEEFWDKQSRNLNTIKGLLIDISIKDFIKECNEELTNESCLI